MRRALIVAILSLALLGAAPDRREYGVRVIDMAALPNTAAAPARR